MQQEKRKTQKLKIYVASAKFFFVLGNALKISIPNLATDAELHNVMGIQNEKYKKY